VWKDLDFPHNETFLKGSSAFSTPFPCDCSPFFFPFSGGCSISRFSPLFFFFLEGGFQLVVTFSFSLCEFRRSPLLFDGYEYDSRSQPSPPPPSVCWSVDKRPLLPSLTATLGKNLRYFLDPPRENALRPQTNFFFPSFVERRGMPFADVSPSNSVRDLAFSKHKRPPFLSPPPPSEAFLVGIRSSNTL